MIARPSLRCLAGAAFLGLGLAFAAPLAAQPALRVAGAEIRFGAIGGIEYDDNVRGNGLNKEDDLIARAGVSVEARWEFGSSNYLSLGGDVLYRKYFSESDLDDFELRFDVGAGSGLRWNLKVGPATVILRDTPALLLDTGDARAVDIGSGTVDNTPDQYRRIANNAGVDMVFELRGDGEVRLFAERRDTVPLDDEFDYLREIVYATGISAGTKLRSDLTAGALARFEDRSTRNGVRNDGQRWEIGPTVTWKASEVITVAAELTYADLSFDNNGTLADTSDESGLQYSLQVEHELNSEVRHSLSFGRSFDTAELANSRRVRSYGYKIDWSGLKWAKFNGSVFRRESEDSGGPLAENLDSWHFGLGLEGERDERWTWRAGLSREERDSNLGGRSYSRHRVFAEIRYGF